MEQTEMLISRRVNSVRVSSFIFSAGGQTALWRPKQQTRLLFSPGGSESAQPTLAWFPALGAKASDWSAGYTHTHTYSLSTVWVSVWLCSLSSISHDICCGEKKKINAASFLFTLTLSQVSLNVQNNCSGLFLVSFGNFKVEVASLRCCVVSTTCWHATPAATPFTVLC